MNELCVLQAYNSRTQFAATALQQTAFGIFVAIDRTEVETTAYSNVGSVFSVYVGHHASEDKYDVLLPSCAFSESRGIFMNCVGMAQRTVPAVHFAHERIVTAKPIALASEAVLTTDIVLYAVMHYVLREMTLPMFNTAMLSDEAISLFKWLMPYQLDVISDYAVCAQILRRSTHVGYVRALRYVLSVRSNFETDIITRQSTLFFPEHTERTHEDATGCLVFSSSSFSEA